MIIPISIGLALWRSRQKHQDLSVQSVSALANIRSILPVFIGWFLLTVTANTIGLVPSSWHVGLSDIAQVMITIALAAIGLSTNFRDIRRAGMRPLALGAMLWLLVTLASLGLQWATGTLS